MHFIADLHIHSHFSRATSKDLTLEHLSRWAQLKGVQLVATGDIAHPGWLAEMKERLVPAEEGLFRLKDDIAAEVQANVPAACQDNVRFMLAGEISNIYKKNGKVRKIHHVLFLPDFPAVERLQAALDKIGNIRSDGRPILGLDSRDLLEILLEADPRSFLIPAHIWTPWFALFGSMSGFDTIEECFDDLTPHIFALETGLSSDPPMNWRLSALDNYTLVSNSDAHSPQKLAREANVFTTELSYPAIYQALKSGDPQRFGGTIEFFPEEGKYHYDGHRKCGIRWEPAATLAHDKKCSVCGRPVTVGVMHRVNSLADCDEGRKPARWHPFQSLISLPEVLGQVQKVGPASKRVQQAYAALLAKLGAELTILRDLPLEDIEHAGGAMLAEGIRRMRNGDLSIAAGYDGEYGTIKLFHESERAEFSEQAGLFATAPARKSSAQSAGPPAPTMTEQAKAADSLSLARAPHSHIDPDGADPAPAAASQPGDPEPSLSPGQTGNTARLLWEQHSLFAESDGLTSSRSTSVLPADPAKDDASSETAAAEESLLSGLNREQQQAVRCTDTSLAIIAGPGTGKTRTLTYRMAYILQTHKAGPEQLLAITFTNKAAGEMAERLMALLGEELARRVTINTFHAFSAAILRAEGERCGIPTNFVICSEQQQQALLKMVSPDSSQKEIRQHLEHISQAKNRLLAPDAAELDELFKDVPETKTIYGRYESALQEHHMLDFDDLIMKAILLFEALPELLESYRRRYRWIAVDEYQDINYAQYRLLRLLAGHGVNLCVIGDPDQAIYGFRGARREYFLRFQDDVPGALVLRLNQNYRSTQMILKASGQVIDREGQRGPGAVWSGIVSSTKLSIYRAPTHKAEAEYVVHQVEKMVGGTSYFSLDSGRVDADDGSELSFGDVAVLYRLGSQSRDLEEAFARSGIPFQTVGETPFFTRPVPREILSLLTLLVNPNALVSSNGLLGGAVGDSAIKALHKLALQSELERVSFWQVLSAQRSLPSLSAAETKAMDGIRPFLLDLKQRSTQQPVGATIESVNKFLLGRSPALDDDTRADFVKRMQLKAAPFGDRLQSFMEAAALYNENDEYDSRADRVTLMTLHASKGLEFPLVFIVGCEEGLIPYRRPGSKCDVDEERRLLYVGMTRARDKLILTHAARRYLFGQSMEHERSHFVADIEEALVEFKMAEARAKLKTTAEAEPDPGQLKLF